MKLFQGFNFNQMWNKTSKLLAAMAVVIGVLMVSVPTFGMITVESLAYNSLLYLNGDFSKAGSSAATDFKGRASQMTLLGVNFKNTVASDVASQLVSEAQIQEENQVEPEVIGKPLSYPNPARQSDNPKFFYVLSKNMDIEIRIYDMLANMILKSEYPAGSQGGKSGSNWLTISDSTFDQVRLSAGVYFVLIMHEGKVLGKGKVAIIP